MKLPLVAPLVLLVQRFHQLGASGEASMMQSSGELPDGAVQVTLNEDPLVVAVRE